MKYLKFTYVDITTGVSVAAEPALNGTKFPAVPGLAFSWARESAYPTEVPEFFGICPDASPTQVDGVLGVFVEADFNSMQADEMNARAMKASEAGRITKLAFRNRFTTAEKVALEIAALDDPTAPMQQRAQAAALRANQADLAAATFVDLDRPDTRAGVQMLEAAGLLAEGRTLVILDTPVTAEERPL
jgi:hypothetical protein